MIWCNSLKSLSNNNSSQIKIINDNLINDIEKIDSLIETIEKNDIRSFKNNSVKILDTQPPILFLAQTCRFKEENIHVLKFIDKTKKYIEIFSN